jgi:hypothetical protein
MKRFSSVLVLAALIMATANAHAAGTAGKTAARTTTFKGEIVDLGCYLGHGARGADHKSCATRCIANGMPFGLLTSDGKLYLLTLNHDNPDPYNRCKDMAAEAVEVTGSLMQRNGIVALDVSGVKAAK